MQRYLDQAQAQSRRTGLSLLKRSGVARASRSMTVIPEQYQFQVCSGTTPVHCKYLEMSLGCTPQQTSKVCVYVTELHYLIVALQYTNRVLHRDHLT